MTVRFSSQSRRQKKVEIKCRNRIDNTKRSVYNKDYREGHKIETIGANYMKQFKQELFELLTIQAPSGKEEKVVKYVQPILEGLCDKVFTDGYGNLLAEKKIGNGKGATVVLSAHMDTVSGIKKGRKVLWDEEKQIFTSSKGILGADDRAGIAIILAILRNLDKVTFDGTIKVAFCKEEEVGCFGSEQIPLDFYRDANLAIVVDRRGNRDIVTGCGVMNGFCSKEVGEFFENVSALLDMEWKAVAGGVSDAYTFSGNGVNSVNLSAGYNNEHTDKEFVHVPSCRDTINLVLQAFSSINSQYHKFGAVPETKRWSWGRYDYDYGYKAKGGFNDTVNLYAAQDDYDFNGEVTFYDAYETFGNVTGSTISGYVSLYQASTDGDKKKAQEVFMSENKFRKMIDQYCLVTGYQAGRQLKSDSEQERLDRQLKDAINNGTEYLYRDGIHYVEDKDGELIPVERVAVG